MISRVKPDLAKSASPARATQESLECTVRLKDASEPLLPSVSGRRQRHGSHLGLTFAKFSLGHVENRFLQIDDYCPAVDTLMMFTSSSGAKIVSGICRRSWRGVCYEINVFRNIYFLELIIQAQNGCYTIGVHMKANKLVGE